MQLDGPQLRQLQQALITAYPTRSAFEQMVFHGLDMHLDAITTQGGLEQAVFELLRWAQAQGRGEELVQAALASNSQNPELLRVAEQLGVYHDQAMLSGKAQSMRPAVWNIPYPRNPFFTGQETVLSELATRLNAGEATALSQPQAITGLGGIGKTQIAVEYAYQHREQYQAVFWVLSDTHESLVSGYSTIAELLNLLQKQHQDQAVIVQAVKSWLQTQRSWLLIMDNADELEIVRDFVPPTPAGHLLLTTRAQSMGRLAKRVEVDTMEQDVGALFLLRRATLTGPDAHLSDALPADVEAAKTICEEVGGLPLALDQAGAYIEQSQCSVSDYLSLYRTQRAVLLARRGGVVSDHPEPVATTWSISFEKVEQSNLAAADLLRFCAFVHPDAIAIEMITKGADHLSSCLQETARSPLLLNDAIAALLAYSLIQRNVKGKALSVHQLVQAVLKDGMDEQVRQQWAKRVVMALNAAFPNVDLLQKIDDKYWDLIPHAQSCATLIQEWDFVFPEAAQLLHKAGAYLSDNTYYAEALQFLQRAIVIREQILGSTHLDTAQSLDNLAKIYEIQGNYQNAIALYQQVWTVRKQTLGSTHPDTRVKVFDLMMLHQIVGNEAEHNFFSGLYTEILGVQKTPRSPRTRAITRVDESVEQNETEQKRVQYLRHTDIVLLLKRSIG